MKRVKFRDRKQGAEASQYILALTLLQKRQDDAGKRLPLLSAEEIAGLTPGERRKLRRKGWGAKLSREDFLALRLKSQTH